MPLAVEYRSVTGNGTAWSRVTARTTDRFPPVPSSTVMSPMPMVGGCASSSTIVPGADALCELPVFVAVNTKPSASDSKVVSSSTGTLTVCTNGPPGVKVRVPDVEV